MIYVVGMVGPRAPVEISRHHTQEKADRSARLAVERMPTATKYGLFIHEAEGSKDAMEIAKIRAWAQDEYDAIRKKDTKS